MLHPFVLSLRRWPAFLVLLVLPAGCSYHYSQGKYLESKNRWEEASIEYRLAYLDNDSDPDYKSSMERANKVTARENLERYHLYLAQKEFRKAYARLEDALQQDPDLAPAQEEIVKWQRVLVAGQISFDFDQLPKSLTLADEIRLVARINSPNPGEVLEAPISLPDGIFFVEDLLYEPGLAQVVAYTLNAVGVKAIDRKSDKRMFASTRFQRLVGFQTPILERLQGESLPAPLAETRFVQTQRAEWKDNVREDRPWAPPSGLHYRLNLEGGIYRAVTDQGRADYAPRFVYMNRPARRMLVDFGRYKISQNNSERWGISRLPLGETDYFPQFARNVALQPYFFYHENILTISSPSGG